MTKAIKKPVVSSIMSSIAQNSQISLEDKIDNKNENIEENPNHYSQETSSPALAIKPKGKNKDAFIANIIVPDTSFEKRKNVLVNIEKANKLGMLSKATGFNQQSILDGILNDFFHRNSDNIKQLLKDFL